MSWRLGERVDHDELLSIGGETLTLCLAAYKPGLAPFAPYYEQRLRWAFLTALRRERRRAIDSRKGVPSIAAERYHDVQPNAIRRTRDQERGRRPSLLEARFGDTGRGKIFPAGDLIGDAISSDPSPADDVARGQLRRRLSTVVASLPERAQRLIREHYVDDLELCEIAERWKVNRSTISRLHKKTLQTLHKRMREHGLSADE